MVMIRYCNTVFISICLLAACAPQKVGADTHVWNVTAKNGDKMTGCLAEDIKPDVLGYIDIEALPDFNITTFDALTVDPVESMKTGKIKTYLANMSNTHHPAGLRDTREDKIKHCDAYPPPKGATEWYFFRTRYPSVEYRMFSLGDKMVFIDARIDKGRSHKSQKP